MILLTSHSEAYKPLADVTIPGKINYCSKWGIEFHGIVMPVPVSCWQRPHLWLDTIKNLPEGDWLFFMGCDTLITNPEFNVRWLCYENSDFVFCADGNGLQCDVWLMRRCGVTIDLLNAVCSHEAKGTCNEQDALSVELSDSSDYGEFTRTTGDLKQGGEPPNPDLLKKLNKELNRSPVRCTIIPQRWLNAYPHEFYGGTGLEEHSWHPGDFVAHMPGKSISLRIETFKRMENERLLSKR